MPEKRMRYLKGIVANYMGEIFLNIDDAPMDEAEACIKKAIETDERYQTRWQLAKGYALHADFFKKKGDIEQARESYNGHRDLPGLWRRWLGKEVRAGTGKAVRDFHLPRTPS
jgi:hypothetical protein